MVYKKKMVVRRRRTYKPKSMKAIAKRVVKTTLSRRIERKRLPVLLEDLSMGATAYYYINPISHIVEGTDESQRVGDKLSNVRLQLGIQYYHVGTAPLGAQLWQGSQLRVIVFKTRQQNTTTPGAWTQKTANDATGFPSLFANQFQGTSAPVNTHEFTVLYDRTIKSSTPNGGGNFGIPVTHRMSIPLAKSWRYTPVAPLTSGPYYGKFNNIYVLVVAQGVTGSINDTVGRLQAAGYLTWSDA